MVKRSVFSVLIIFILILSSHSLVLGIEESNNNLMYNNNYILEKNEDIEENENYKNIIETDKNNLSIEDISNNINEEIEENNILEKKNKQSKVNKINEDNNQLMKINATNVGVVNNNTTFDSDYSWSFKYISGVTTTTSGGMTNYTADSIMSDGSIYGNDKYYSARLTSNSQKGNIWVRYNNVGTYNGEIVDLKVTLSGWDYLQPANTSANQSINSVNYPTVFFEKDAIKTNITSYPAIDSPVFTYNFYKHNTNTAISIKCHATFKDIDSGEYFIPTSGFNSIYKYTKSNLSTFSTSKIGVDYGIVSDSTDKAHWATCLISGSNFKFTYTRIQDLKNNNTYRDITKTASAKTRSNFMYRVESGCLAPFEFTELNKKVSVNEITGTDSFTYTISQFIPGEDNAYHYSKYVLSDTIPDCFLIKNVVVKDDSTTRTGWFNINTNNNIVTATATSTALSNNNFYNNNLYFTITVQKKDKYNMNSWYNGSLCSVPNKASVNLASPTVASTRTATKTSNIVNVNVYFKILTSVKNGKISESINKIPAGSNKTINYSPNRNYKLSSIKVNGKEVNIDTYTSNYTFSNILEDSKIEVIYEPIYTKINLVKENKHRNKLKGATFELYAAEDIYLGDDVIYKKDNIIDTSTTNDEGTIIFSQLLPGNYYLIESKSPNNYELIGKKISVKILDDSIVNIKIVDEEKKVLPMAGGCGIIVSFVGIFFIIISYLIHKKNIKEEKNDKKI